MFARLCVAILAIALWNKCVFSQQENDEALQAATAKRFLSIVERNPQRGTALEKVFDHHLQLGTLDRFIDELKLQTKLNASDGTAWMLLGLFESQRRMDAQANLAFAEAEKIRTNDALPAYYRGQSLLRLGEPEQAIAAFEMAIERKPTRIILLELFEQLGRTHLRQKRNELAVEAWTRLESLFPNDLHVLEQMASVQIREGDFANALPRYERLISMAKDATQRIQFRIECAQLRIQLGDSAKGMLELESILAELKPDGWLFRDVQRKIEQVFLKSSNQTGLIEYYEKRLAKYPDDIESMVRLCKFLVSSGRVADANRWIVQAIERAPSRLDLRKTQLEQLVAEKKFSIACEQYEQLARLDPTNSDVLRDWGKTVLLDPNRKIEEAQTEASRIWKKIVEGRPEQALAFIQVADLLQSAQLPNEAQSFFERAIEMEPEQAQYREYYGQFLFDQHQREQAYETWEAIAVGARRNAGSVMRLAEIYDHVEQTEKAVVLASEACRLTPHDTTAFVKTARFQKKAGLIDEALQSLSIAGKMAESDDQRENIVLDRIAILEANNRLKSETAALHLQIQQEKEPVPADLQLLARYLVRQKRWKEASSAVSQALKLDASNLAMLLVSAEVAEGLGNGEQSIQSLRKLADLDRRKRADYLERIARQQLRQQKFAEAIKSAQEVVQAAPSKIESYEFLSQVCFQAMKPGLGIEALRKALRMDPNSVRLTLALAQALAANQNQIEAIELYWQIFTTANSLDEKIDLSMKLLKVFQQKTAMKKVLNSSVTLSPLIDRMETLRKDPAQYRDTTICIAQVYQSVSDFASAKRTLEELLNDRTRDTAILQQIAKLCVASGDLDLAINYQRQLVDMAPGSENESYLANLHRQRGDSEAADEIVVRLLQNEPDQVTAIKNIDILLQRGDCELVLQILEPLLRNLPDNWELLYRRGIAHAFIDQWDESRATWESILSLEVDRRDVGLRPGAKANKGSSENTEVIASGLPGSHAKHLDVEILDVMNQSELADIASGRTILLTDPTLGTTGPHWSPKNFGEMRVACIARLVLVDTQDANGKSDWIRRMVEQADGNATRSVLIDAMAVFKFRQDLDGQIRIAATLAEGSEPEMQQIYLELVRNRQVAGIAAENRNRKPLSDSQIELMLEAFESVDEERISFQSTKPSAGRLGSRTSRNIQMQFATQAMVYNQHFNMQSVQQMPPSALNTARVSGAAIWTTGPTFPGYNSNAIPNWQIGLPVNATASTNSANRRSEGFVRTVVNELRFAGRPDKADAFVMNLRAEANTEFKLASLCEYLIGAQRFQEIESPLLRWFQLQPSQKVGNPSEFAVRLFETWGQQATTESAVRVLDSALSASNQSYVNRNFPPLNASSLTSLIRPRGDDSPLIQAWCTSFVSIEEQRLLHVTRGLFGQSSRLNDWLSYLQERMMRSDPELLPLEQLRLELFAEERTASASIGARVVEVLEAIGREPECSLHAAQALLLHQGFDAARRVADALEPSNAQASQLRELVILHASAALKDKGRTEASLQSLDSQTLDNATLQSMALPLQRAASLGIVSAAKLLPTQSTNPTFPTPSQFMGSLPSQRVPPKEAARLNEMNKHARNGHESEAIKIARQIINKPRIYPLQGEVGIQTIFYSSGPSVQVRRRQMPQRSTSDSFDAARTTAFSILTRFDDLKKLIAETELRLKSSPNSFVLLEELSEQYEYAGDASNTERTTLQALQIRPSASQLRVHYAAILQKAGKINEACDQYIILLKRDPNCGLWMLSELVNLFALNGRTSDLLKAVQSARFQAVIQREELLDMVLTLVDDPRGIEIGGVVVERLVQLDPQLRQQSLMLLYGYGKRNFARLFDFVIDTVIPKENEAIQSPWFGLQDHETYLPTGEAIFAMLLMSNRQEEIEKKLEPSVRAAVDRMPGWLAGKVMLAMIVSRLNKPTEAKLRFSELASINRIAVGCPDGVAWRLTKEFLELPEARKTAIRLATGLIGNSRFANLEPEMQPNMLLAKLWIADGEREKAVEMLTREYETGTAGGTAYGSKASPVVRRSSSTPVPSLADIILESGLPVESYRLFEKHTDEHVKSVNQMLQNSGSITTREAGRQAAIKQLELLPPDKAVNELLRDRSNAARNYPVLELMFQVPLENETSNKAIESALQSTLIRHAKAGMTSEIELGLQKLLISPPSDISVLATQARLRVATGTGDAESVLLAIDQIGSALDAEIEQLLSNVKVQSNSIQQPRFAQNLVATWLVARQCYEDGLHLAIADRIATRAVKVAKLMDSVGPGTTKSQFANIMLLEWGKVQIQSGRTEDGIARWQKLMSEIENAPNATKQWTQNQFDWMMRMAGMAIEVRQMELSYDIARKVSKRGMPAPQPPESMRKASSGFSYQFDTQSAMKPSVKAVSALLRKWGDQNSPSAVCYELLVPLVFPNDKEIVLYADQTRALHLLHEEPTTLASKLVYHAARANRLNELQAMIHQRSDGVNDLVMHTQIAIARTDYEEAKSLLTKLLENYRATNSMNELTTSCQVAIPAFHCDELREAALPILRELIASEKKGGNHSEANFKQFPLVREVDEYKLFKSKEKP